KITVKRDGEEKTIALPEDFLGQLSTSKNRRLFELRLPFLVSKVSDTSLNKSADLKKGDLIKTVEGQSVEYFDQVQNVLQSFKGQTVSAEILRDGQAKHVNLQVDENGLLGIETGGVPFNTYAELGYFDIVKKDYTLGE